MSSQQKSGGLPETDHDIFGEYRVAIPIALNAEQIPRGPYQKRGQGTSLSALFLGTDDQPALLNVAGHRFAHLNVDGWERP